MEYYHSLGIYHQDLKPENILCFDDSFWIAIRDFGLTTMEKFSAEFRTGSIYHMSPGKYLSFFKFGLFTNLSQNAKVESLLLQATISPELN